MIISADVIVIGSGIIGNATAYYFAKNGLDVKMIDAGGVGFDGGCEKS